MTIRSQSSRRLSAVSFNDLAPHIETFHATIVEVRALIANTTTDRFKPRWRIYVEKYGWFALALICGACVFGAARAWSNSTMGVLSANEVSYVLTGVGGGIAIFGNTVDPKFRWRVTPVGLFAALLFLSTTQVNTRKEREDRKQADKVAASFQNLNETLEATKTQLTTLKAELVKGSETLIEKNTNIQASIASLQGAIGDEKSGVIYQLNNLPNALPEKIATAVAPKLPTADGIATAVAPKLPTADGIATAVAPKLPTADGIATAVAPKLPTADGIATAVVNSPNLAANVGAKLATPKFASDIANNVKVDSKAVASAIVTEAQATELFIAIKKLMALPNVDVRGNGGAAVTGAGGTGG